MGSSLGKVSPSLNGHVDSLFSSFEDLFAAGEAVEQLVGGAGWAHVLAVLDAEISTIERRFDERLLESRSDYAFAHGRLGGLRAARSAAEAILGRAALRLEQQQRKHDGGADALPDGS